MPRAARRPVRTQKKKKSSATTQPPALSVRNEADVKKALNILKSHPLTVVLVFANWCPHCHSYMPTWKKLEKTPNRSVPMIAVEQQNAEPILNSMGTTVEGYPTVFAATRTQNESQPNVGEPIANPREENTMKNLLVNGNSALGNQPIPNGNVESVPEPTIMEENTAKTAKPTPVPSATPAAMSNEPVTLPTVANSIKASNRASANSRRMADQMLNSGFTAPPDVDLATPPAKESLNMPAKSKQAGGNPTAAAGTLFDALSSYSAGSAVSKLASIAGLLGTYHMVKPATRRARSRRQRSRSARK